MARTSVPSPADLHTRVADSFARQGMMRQLGAKLRHVEPGRVEIWLPDSDQVTRQQSGFHGSVWRAVGEVLKPGKRLIVTTAEITHVDDKGQQRPCALMQQTIVPVPLAK